MIHHDVQDEMSWDDLSRGRDDWPEVQTVTEYRRKAYPLIRKVIEDHPGLEPGSTVKWGDAAWAIFMGFEHERIHIETSSVLIREVRDTLRVFDGHNCSISYSSLFSLDLPSCPCRV